MPTNKEIADALQRRLESAGGSRKVVIGAVLAWEIIRRLREKEKTDANTGD